MTQTANFYSHSHNKGALLRAGGAELSIISPTTGNAIAVTEVKLKSERVKDSVIKSIYNRRSWELLTPSAVIDIFREIEHDKRNTTPVIAVKRDDGKYEIIAGLRRCFAVSIVHDAELFMHVAQSMTEEDKAAIAKRADTYKAPSLIDFGLTLKEYKQQVGEGSFSVRKAADIFGINKTAVSEALRFSELSTDFLRLFPDIELISRRFLRKITSSDVGQEHLKEVINNISAPIVDLSLVEEGNEQAFIKKITLELEKEIIAFLSVRNKKPDLEVQEKAVWSDSLLKDNVIVKQVRDGVRISLPLSLVNSEVGEKIRELLKA